MFLISSEKWFSSRFSYLLTIFCFHHFFLELSGTQFFLQNSLKIKKILISKWTKTRIICCLQKISTAVLLICEIYFWGRILVWFHHVLYYLQENFNTQTVFTPQWIPYTQTHLISSENFFEFFFLANFNHMLLRS